MVTLAPPQHQPNTSNRRPQTGRNKPLTAATLTQHVPPATPFILRPHGTTTLDTADGLDTLTTIRTLDRNPFIHGGATAEGWRPLSRWTTTGGRPNALAITPTLATVTDDARRVLADYPGVLAWVPLRDGIMLMALGEKLRGTVNNSTPGHAYSVCTSDSEGVTFRALPLTPHTGVTLTTTTGPNLTPTITTTPPGRLPTGTVFTRIGHRYLTAPTTAHKPPTDVLRGLRPHRGLSGRTVRHWGWKAGNA